MAHDLVVRGGQLVDGAGGEPRPGDLAIDDGLITAVGEVSGRGKREIDAEGQMVTPGFVDIHTHLDAQVGWDPNLTPVSWHGVTTALMGNCGVTFAPCKPADKELLAGMMETVEDIPKHAILNGLSWDWEDYGGYLDAIDRLKPAINIAGMVGHCAVRFYVMGERAVEEQATEDEKRQMADIVAHSIDQGAVGFSTNRYPPHVLPDGRSIPGTFADPDELMQIAKAIAPRNALMQNVLDFSDRAFSAGLLRDMGPHHGQPGAVQFRGFPQNRNPASGRLDSSKGSATVAWTSPPSRSLGDLDSSFPCSPYCRFRVRHGSGSPPWTLPNDGRPYRIPKPARPSLPRPRRPMRPAIPMDQVFFMGAGEVPEYVAKADENLQAMADAAGEHWSETFLRLSKATEGRGLFTFRMFNRSLEALADLFRSERVFPSLGDAGAHVSQIMDAGWATFVLSHWVRETGLYSMGEAVRRLTSAPARIIGLKDRGVLAPGKRADVNVFDADTVAERQPQTGA